MAGTRPHLKAVTRRGARRSATVLAVMALLSLLAACRLKPAGAWPLLEDARRLDAQVEGAAQPEQVAAARDRAWQHAEQRWSAILRVRPDDPEAHLALALIAWQARSDAPTALAHLRPLIARLGPQPAAQLAARGPAGRTGTAVLAEAYALRAAVGLGGTEAPTPSSLGQALADVEQAVRLDPRADYQRLREDIRQMQAAAREEGTQPLDPATLLPAAPGAHSRTSPTAPAAHPRTAPGH